MSTEKQDDLRLRQLEQWLKSILEDDQWQLEVASADASFRRYFRVLLGDKTLIAMDAPPDKEDIAPFIHAATAFKQRGVNVPDIYARDLAQGFMLLQDFGNTSFLQQLNEQTADEMYSDAMQALLDLQTRHEANETPFPAYDYALLMREMALFSDWFLGRHLSLKLTEDEQQMLADCYEFLCQNALQQPQVWVHRDYHSRNLMAYPQDNPGIIDFQDAVLGAISYDLVSLLRDCYISWPDEKVYTWVEKYLNALQEKGMCMDVAPEEFKRWFDLMGMQRHLKAIGIFSRLNYRDGKPGYLQDIPRTLAYVESVSARYPELAAFEQFLRERIKPALERASQP